MEFGALKKKVGIVEVVGGALLMASLIMLWVLRDAVFVIGNLIAVLGIPVFFLCGVIALMSGIKKLSFSQPSKNTTKSFRITQIIAGILLASLSVFLFFGAFYVYSSPYYNVPGFPDDTEAFLWYLVAAFVAGVTAVILIAASYLNIKLSKTK